MQYEFILFLDNSFLFEIITYYMYYCLLLQNIITIFMIKMKRQKKTPNKADSNNIFIMFIPKMVHL